MFLIQVTYHYPWVPEHHADMGHYTQVPSSQHHMRRKEEGWWTRHMYHARSSRGHQGSLGYGKPDPASRRHSRKFESLSHSFHAGCTQHLLLGCAGNLKDNIIQK